MLTDGRARLVLRELLRPVARPVRVVDSGTYRSLGVKWYAGGVFVKPTTCGGDIKATRLFRVCAGDFVYNRLFAWKGSFALVEPEHDGCMVSSEFPTFEIRTDRVLPEYLRWYFSVPALWEAIGGLSSGTSQTSRLRFKEQDFLSLVIALPPLSEQDRIVRILDEAARLRRLREQADGRTSDLIPAIFHEMFGDLATNSKAWPLSPLSDLAEVQGGLQLSSARDGLPLRRPYLRVANVQRGYLDLQEVKHIALTEAELERTLLRTMDLLLVEGNGNPREIGRAAVWDGSIENCVHQNHLIRVRCRPTMLDPYYLLTFINSDSGRAYFFDSGNTTSGLVTISTGIVKKCRIPTPPVSLQRSFAVRVAEVRAIEEKQAESRRRLDDLFQSLLHRAFAGEL